MYEVRCANCDKTYVGETGRKLHHALNTQFNMTINANISHLICLCILHDRTPQQQTAEKQFTLLCAGYWDVRGTI